MADTTQLRNVTEVSLPETGRIVEYQISSDVPVKLTFYVSEVIFSSDGNDLVMTGEHGGMVVIKDYLVMAQSDSLPVFELHGGEHVPGDVYLFAFNETVLNIETAAGPLNGGNEAETSFDESVSHGNLLPAPPVGVEEDSSALDPVHIHGLGHAHSEFLQYADIFADHVGDGLPGVSASTVCGASMVAAGADASGCSLADVYDPFDDLLQIAVHSPLYL